jgi:8-oxo-dGTP pyrophosphatase MutT (NUDIX family)
MRQSIGAAALIRRQDEGQTLYLAQWNPRWQKYNFISGHKRPDETFRQCLEREVNEELHLHKDVDFVVAGEPLSHVEYTAWSEGAKAQTQYTTELFSLQLNGNAARRRVDENPANRWLTEDEIQSAKCADGAPVSETMRFLLSKLKE